MLSNSTTQDSVALATCLRAVSDPARLRLLRLCADRPTSVSELSLATGESEPNVSRQLKQLATAGLLQRVRRGQRVEYLPVAAAGFAAELLQLLLLRVADDETPLREARARLRSMEAVAPKLRVARSVSQLNLPADVRQWTPEQQAVTRARWRLKELRLSPLQTHRIVRSTVNWYWPRLR